MTAPAVVVKCKNPECKEEFQPRKPWQKFCSSRCRDFFWGKVRNEAKALVEGGFGG